MRKLSAQLLAFFITFPVSITLLTPAHADTEKWQGFDVHYTTFKSTLIPREVAALHNIVRSERRIVTNISLRKDGEPVAARVEGYNTNLLNQLFAMDFTEVKEQEAIYYLADQLVDEKDTLRYTIEIQPENHPNTLTLKFTRDYFSDSP